jgi:integrase
MRTRTGCVRYRRGRWELDFRDVRGRRHQEALGDLRERGRRWQLEAEARLHERLKEVNGGTYQAPDEHSTVSELVKLYIDNHVVPNGAEPETIQQYRQEARLYLTPNIGSMKAREVRRVHIEELRARLLATSVQFQRRGCKEVRKLSPRTVRKALTLLAAAYRYGQSLELVMRDPTLGVRKPSKKSAGPVQVQVLTTEELNRLFEHLRDHSTDHATRSGPWKLLVRFAVFTGMRESELCGLTWEDVDFETCTVRVRRIWRRGRFKLPKTASSIRKVEFPSSMLTELKAWRLACPKGEHGFMFPTESGGPQNPSNMLKRGLRPALKRAGLPETFRFHDLRHTYATLQLSSGENVGPVSRQLGHANIAITQSVYRHHLPGEGSGLADRLAQRVRDGSGGKVVATEREKSKAGS